MSFLNFHHAPYLYLYLYTDNNPYQPTESHHNTHTHTYTHTRTRTLSEKWNGSMSSKNGSSVHGLLTDADSVDDDMELIDLQKKTGSGVEVSFNGKKSSILISNTHILLFLKLILITSSRIFSDHYFNYCMLLDVSFHYPEQPVEKVTTCPLLCSALRACALFCELSLSHFTPLSSSSLIFPSLTPSYLFFSPLCSCFLISTPLLFFIYIISTGSQAGELYRGRRNHYGYRRTHWSR